METTQGSDQGHFQCDSTNSPAGKGFGGGKGIFGIQTWEAVMLAAGSKRCLSWHVRLDGGCECTGVRAAPDAQRQGVCMAQTPEDQQCRREVLRTCLPLSRRVTMPADLWKHHVMAQTETESFYSVWQFGKGLGTHVWHFTHDM